jgi:hypothetical protein
MKAKLKTNNQSKHFSVYRKCPQSRQCYCEKCPQVCTSFAAMAHQAEGLAAMAHPAEGLAAMAHPAEGLAAIAHLAEGLCLSTMLTLKVEDSHICLMGTRLPTVSIMEW